LYSSFSKKKNWEQMLRTLFESENPPKSFRDMEIKIPLLMIDAWEEEQP
jgi:hypothetical protein